MARQPSRTGVPRALEVHRRRLMRYPNVSGVGMGPRQVAGEFSREIAVQVFVSRKYPLDHLPDDAIIPPMITGARGATVRTDVIEAGFLRPFDDDTARYRPVPAGCSVSGQTEGGATLGAWACDLADGETVLLTANHVLTPDGGQGGLPSPAGILQPGLWDGGIVPDDVVGQVKRLVPITTSPTDVDPPTTPVDAAIGSLSAEFDDDVLEIGPAIYEVGAPDLWTDVQKRGRTTQLTTNGQIKTINASWTTNYGTVDAPAYAVIGGSGAGVFVFSTDGNAFALPGDSGSVLFSQKLGALELSPPALGIVTAGGSLEGMPEGTLVAACDINVIFDQLKLGTLCDCGLKAFLDALPDPAAASATERAVAASRKEIQLRQLRDRLLPKTALGKAAVDLLMANRPALSKALMRDEQTFALALKTFEPWVRKRANYDLLESKLDATTVELFSRLADRLGKLVPELKAELSALGKIAVASEGMKLRDALRKGSLGPKRARPRKHDRRAR